MKYILISVSALFLILTGACTINPVQTGKVKNEFKWKCLWVWSYPKKTEKEICDMTKEEVVQYADSVALHYNRHSPGNTGALDIITAIIFDYRAYDTLIETTVLFTAMIGVLSIIGTKRN